MPDVRGVTLADGESVCHQQRPRWYSYYSLRFDFFLLPVLWWYRRRNWFIITTERIINVTPRLRSHDVASYQLDAIRDVAVSDPPVDLPYSNTGTLTIQLEASTAEQATFAYIREPDTVATLLRELL